jgi:hypothetical protein
MDRDAKKQLLLATADIGKVRGMRAGAEIMRALIQGRKRIDAGELKAAAIAMDDAADELDARTDLTLLALRAEGEGL